MSGLPLSFVPRRPTPAAALRRLVLCAACALALFTTLAPPAQAQDDIVITPGGMGRNLLCIAVPAFQQTGGQQLSKTSLADVVTNDMKLSGFFRAPQNKTFVEQNQLIDQQSGSINFPEWQRIGAQYLVKGNYEINGSGLVAEVKLYDTTNGGFIFGRRYEDYTVDAARTLAHRISDDIFKQLVVEEGVANTRIAFVRQVDPHGKTKQVSVMDADGFGARALTPMGELTATPAWGAKGGELFYTTYRDFNPDLAGVILRSGHTWWVSRRSGFNISPNWSESRQRIALTLTRDGNSEIYTISREGKDPQRLTIDKAIDSSPCWSRDGSKLIFTSDRSGRPHIWAMDVASKQVQRLTYQGDYNDGAVWSPAGAERIAFMSRIGGDFQIFVMNADGSNVQQVTNGPYNNEDPTWSPNGLLLAFTSDRTGKKQIYSMYAGGGDAYQLTKGNASQSPAWSPATP